MSSQKQPVETLSTPRDLVLWAEQEFNKAKLFFGHGTDNALDEAVLLVFHVFGFPFDISDEKLDSPATEEQRKRAVELIQKRIETRKPASYLINKAWFLGREYYVDERVLVPRSPIAELIETQFSPWVDASKVKNILDLCTGSGCIALGCAEYFPDTCVTGSDISKEALEVAAINKQKIESGNRVEFVQSDVFQDIPEKMYDIIISNPPYVDAEDMALLPEEFRHEPALGLEAGPDGLEIVHRILQQAGQFMADKGILVVEVGNSQEAVINTYPNVPFTWLEFEYGGDGVFLLTAEQVKALGN
ncbi:MAG: 50S ribosomal protein L3 N(5)-glutamine methyltransferase [Gammaproteobacteria bacterium]|nr:50S ribosomal protein L3 N(5)-glutamine methyltransferase [Gammaproteobacteria bacterium]MDH5593611.1 50S ribosomal protein L3 N(5)-glutamine methyltransferase [Gammaproteobacteria bacterium]MDH5613596.1 50S ribosomal protein L3 N(5)-glutamine methyltransferase [Gammaproteobacteria bacterium]